MRALTRQAHAGQTRNGGRLPYWVHTDNVAGICRQALLAGGELDPARPDGEDVVIAAHGHDLYEDTGVSAALVRAEFGAGVDDLIAALTNESGDHDLDGYLARLATATDEARVVKSADLVDNLLSVAYGLHDLGLPWVREFLLPIVTRTRDVLRATPFTRLPRTGQQMLDLVEFAWARLQDSIVTADGESWAQPNRETAVRGTP